MELIQVKRYYTTLCYKRKHLSTVLAHFLRISCTVQRVAITMCLQRRYSFLAGHLWNTLFRTMVVVMGLVLTWWGGEKVADGQLALQRPLLVRPVAGAAPDRFYPYGATGQGRYQVHHGVEFVCPLGTPVLAAAEGTVVVAGSDTDQVWGRHLGYYGQLIVIRLAQRDGPAPIYVLYGHLSQIDVRLGQYVRQGEEIGRVGSSGIALGPHLHFEVRLGANTFAHTRNPELWLEPLAGHGTIIGRILDAQGRLVSQALVTFYPANAPNRYWREAWTYASGAQLNSDPEWQENMVMGDVPAGEYLVYVRVAGRLYARRVWVEEGQVTQISIRPQVHRKPLALEQIAP